MQLGFNWATDKKYSLILIYKNKEHGIDAQIEKAD
jgi:hypothetical protein